MLRSDLAPVHARRVCVQLVKDIEDALEYLDNHFTFNKKQMDTMVQVCVWEGVKGEEVERVFRTGRFDL